MTLLQQSPVVAGQPSTVTLLMADANGNPIEQRFDVPPGKNAELPPNLATNEDVAQMVAGTYLLNAQDQRAVGLKWDGPVSAPTLFYGPTGGPTPSLFSHLLGTTPNENYLCANGNSAAQIVGEDAPLMIQRFSTTATNASSITFPTAFAGDKVHVVMLPHFQTLSGGGGAGFILNMLQPANRYSFQLSCWNFLSNSWANTPISIDVLAIGPAPATV